MACSNITDVEQQTAGRNPLISVGRSVGSSYTRLIFLGPWNAERACARQTLELDADGHLAYRQPRAIDAPFRSTARLEREPRAKLNFSSGRSALRDRAELWCVHEAIGCAQVGVVQSIEKLAAELELHRLGNAEVTH